MCITLNRPRVLNSLSLDMVRALTPVYKQLDIDDSVSNFILRGAGRAFCAGGDIVEIFESGKNGTSLCKDFFREEYILNHLIGTLCTPHVAIISGITMGGGVGLSVHGRFRVASDQTLFAMPETGIGFFPDVGGSYFLPRLEGSLGMYLGLTGAKLKGKHVAAAGVATHYVSSESIGELENALFALTTKDPQQVQAVIDKFATPATWDGSEVKINLELINRIFSLDSVEGIFDALKREGTEFAEKTLNTLSKMSPTSLKITHRLLNVGRTLTFEECLELEYNISQHFMKGADFYEGVHELLISKTNSPSWEPPALTEVKQEYLDLVFTPTYDLRFGKARHEEKN